MTVLRMSLNEIYAPIQKELEEFSDCLKKELASDDALIADIHNHLLKMTGKFLRPALAIICSRLEDKRDVRAIRLATAIELIHTATLVHDDIIDDSQMRRNQPSICSKWGREISIVSGDYLYAKAFLLLASLKDMWINEAFAACAHVMCEGEMKQIERRNNFLMSEKEYLKIIHQKTAALFQAACAGGGYLSGTSHKNIENLGAYGYALGMAFQIVDDCLDLTGETESLGKTAGLDVYKNDVTLPLLYLFTDLKTNQRQTLLEEMKEGRSVTFESIKQLALEKGAIEKAIGKAKNYVQESIEALNDFPQSPYKESLTRVSHYCLERIR